MKTVKLLLTTIIAFSAAVSADALSISVTTPGTLATSLASQAADCTELVLDGPVNASDLHFVATTMRSLSTLDLSKTTIAAENNTRLATNIASYPADQLPAYSLSGLTATMVTLPAGLKSIGAGALMSSAITSIVIPESVTEIGNGAFADCRSLVKIDVPATVTTVGSNTFDGCTSLTEVTYGPKSVSASEFRGCTAMWSFKGAPVTIGDNAFAGCTSLAYIELSSALKSIGSKAFYGSGLQSINLSAATSLKLIGDYAFAACNALQSVSLPEGLTRIGKGAFFGDSNLGYMVVPSTVKNYDDFSLKGTALNNGTTLISEATDTIGRYALADMANITTLTLPESLEHISANAMQDMSSLENIDARSLKTVPSLGDDVWNRVNQSAVTLLVDSQTEQAFLASPQWNEFSISTSGTSTGISIDAVTSDNIFATITETEIAVNSSLPIEGVSLYNLEGQLLELRNAAGETTVKLDISSRADRIFILMVSIPSESVVKAIKLAR
ncbi:MAG: leucine-rich repeat domain-containing protein [Lachnoclostridium sp.]|nr:leucine-rich repeat domain-containing protein [Lachnoclostridium sp.]